MTFPKLDPQKGGHDEGSGSHNGRHDLPSGTCHGFHGSCESVGVSQAFHERNGEGAGTVDVGHGGTRNGSEKTGAYHGDLGGTSGGGSRKGLGELHEVFPYAALLQKSAENEEDDNEGGGNSQRNGENSLIGKVDLLHHLGNGEL